MGVDTCEHHWRRREEKWRAIRLRAARRLLDMEWLESPFRFWHPTPGEPFVLRVRRYQVGLAMREVDDPPRIVVRPTIRFHLPPGEGLDGSDYMDFTNRGLIHRVMALWEDLARGAVTKGDAELVRTLEATSPARERAVTLELIRLGERLDTQYEVRVVGV